MKSLLPPNIIINLLNKRCIANIQDRLSPAFIQKVIDAKAVIAGSFILSCMLGEYYPDQDIDIYCNSNGENIFRDELLQDNYTIEHYSFSNGIQKVIRSQDHSIDLIVLEDNITPKDFVFTTFDLSFVRIIFDGTQILFQPYKNTSLVTFLDYRLLFAKVGFLVNIQDVSTMQSMHQMDCITSGCCKEFRNDYPPKIYYQSSRLPQINPQKRAKTATQYYMNQQYYMYIRICTRLIKYKKRGFTIVGQ